MQVLIFVVALLSGIANPFQSATNAELNKRLASPVWTALFVYASGLVVMLMVQAAARSSWPASRVQTVPWWAWTGGAISILSTMAGLMFAQRLGSGLFTAASVTAALVTSVVLDHFGLVGFKQHTASPMRLAGCVLLIGGLWLVAKF